MGTVLDRNSALRQATRSSDRGPSPGSRVGELRAAGVREVLAEVAAAGVRVFVVGGALRDARLGRAVRDVDLLVLEPIERVARVLPEARRIGTKVPLLLLPERPGRVRIEISSLRPGALTLEQDLRLRDFTLNALAFDPQRGILVDPTGGQRDLDTRILRAVDPERCLLDDPLRGLRGLRLACELDLAIEPATQTAIMRNAHRLGGASGERLRDELWRLLALPEPGQALELLRRSGVLAVVLPELQRTVGIGQNRHHPDDVYRHTLRVVELCRPDPLLRLAAALHDAAKPETRRWQPETRDWSFRRHESLARAHVHRAAGRLRLSNAERDRVERLVRHHLLFPDRLESPRALRRMLARVGRDILEDLLELRRADYGSRAGTSVGTGVGTSAGTGEGAPAAWAAAETRIRAFAAGESERPLEISGGDVMRELGLGPGPQVGIWLARARRRAIEQPAGGGRDALLRWLRSKRKDA